MAIVIAQEYQISVVTDDGDLSEFEDLDATDLIGRVRGLIDTHNSKIVVILVEFITDADVHGVAKALKEARFFSDFPVFAANIFSNAVGAFAAEVLFGFKLSSDTAFAVEPTDNVNLPVTLADPDVRAQFIGLGRAKMARYLDAQTAIKSTWPLMAITSDDMSRIRGRLSVFYKEMEDARQEGRVATGDVALNTFRQQRAVERAYLTGKSLSKEMEDTIVRAEALFQSAVEYAAYPRLIHAATSFLTVVRERLNDLREFSFAADDIMQQNDFLPFMLFLAHLTNIFKDVDNVNHATLDELLLMVKTLEQAFSVENKYLYARPGFDLSNIIVNQMQLAVDFVRGEIAALTALVNIPDLALVHELLGQIEVFIVIFTYFMFRPYVKNKPSVATRLTQLKSLKRDLHDNVLTYHDVLQPLFYMSKISKSADDIFYPARGDFSQALGDFRDAFLVKSSAPSADAAHLASIRDDAVSIVLDYAHRVVQHVSLPQPVAVDAMNSFLYLHEIEDRYPEIVNAPGDEWRDVKGEMFAMVLDRIDDRIYNRTDDTHAGIDLPLLAHLLVVVRHNDLEPTLVDRVVDTLYGISDALIDPENTFDFDYNQLLSMQWDSLVDFTRTCNDLAELCNNIGKFDSDHLKTLPASFNEYQKKLHGLYYWLFSVTGSSLVRKWFADTEEAVENVNAVLEGLPALASDVYFPDSIFMPDHELYALLVQEGYQAEVDVYIGIWLRIAENHIKHIDDATLKSAIDQSSALTLLEVWLTKVRSLTELFRPYDDAKHALDVLSMKILDSIGDDHLNNIIGDFCAYISDADPADAATTSSIRRKLANIVAQIDYLTRTNIIELVRDTLYPVFQLMLVTIDNAHDNGIVTDAVSAEVRVLCERLLVMYVTEPESKMIAALVHLLREKLGLADVVPADEEELRLQQEAIDNIMKAETFNQTVKLLVPKSAEEDEEEEEEKAIAALSSNINTHLSTYVSTSKVDDDIVVADDDVDESEGEGEEEQEEEEDEDIVLMNVPIGASYQNLPTELRMLSVDFAPEITSSHEKRAALSELYLTLFDSNVALLTRSIESGWKTQISRESVKQLLGALITRCNDSSQVGTRELRKSVRLIISAWHRIMFGVAVPANTPIADLLFLYMYAIVVCDTDQRHAPILLLDIWDTGRVHGITFKATLENLFVQQTIDWIDARFAALPPDDISMFNKTKLKHLFQYVAGQFEVMGRNAFVTSVLAIPDEVQQPLPALDVVVVENQLESYVQNVWDYINRFYDSHVTAQTKSTKAKKTKKKAIPALTDADVANMYVEIGTHLDSIVFPDYEEGSDIQWVKQMMEARMQIFVHERLDVLLDNCRNNMYDQSENTIIFVLADAVIAYMRSDENWRVFDALTADVSLNAFNMVSLFWSVVNRRFPVMPYIALLQVLNGPRDDEPENEREARRTLRMTGFRRRDFTRSKVNAVLTQESRLWIDKIDADVPKRLDEYTRRVSEPLIKMRVVLTREVRLNSSTHMAYPYPEFVYDNYDRDDFAENVESGMFDWMYNNSGQKPIVRGPVFIDMSFLKSQGLYEYPKTCVLHPQFFYISKVFAGVFADPRNAVILKFLTDTTEDDVLVYEGLYYKVGDGDVGPLPEMLTAMGLSAKPDKSDDGKLQALYEDIVQQRRLYTEQAVVTLPDVYDKLVNTPWTLFDGQKLSSSYKKFISAQQE